MIFDTANWIALATMIITAFAAISSIVIAITTLKQNNKMIEESSRPIITVYKDIININSPIEYLVLKNFGNSSGTITKIEYNEEDLIQLFRKTTVELGLIKYFKNITLAPHQKYMFPIDSNNTEIKNFHISIEYRSATKIYRETFDINLSQDYSITFINQNKSDSKDEIKTISNSLQEIIKRN